MRFWKYHGLGNDYLVVDAGRALSSAEIKRICHRNLGVGSDGILIRVVNDGDGATFAVRIFNPDGSEAEKSGNGLRIFSRYLYDQGLVTDAPFVIDTLGGKTTAQIDPASGLITVSMGRPNWTGQNVALDVGDSTLIGQQVDIGNPHFVVIDGAVSAEKTRAFGPLIETHPRFPNRTNVQFAQVLDRKNLRIEIWERGAGYTLASGSSSCAAATAAHWLQLCDPDLTIHMPGGQLAVHIGTDGMVTQTGPVVRVMDGMISAEIFNA